MSTEETRSMKEAGDKDDSTALMDLLQRALRNHDRIAAALRTGVGNQRLFRAIDDMKKVKEQAADLGCYPSSNASPSPSESTQ